MGEDGDGDGAIICEVLGEGKDRKAQPEESGHVDA